MIDNQYRENGGRNVHSKNPYIRNLNFEGQAAISSYLEIMI